MWKTGGARCLAVLGLAVIGIAAGDRDLRLVDAAKKADGGALRGLLEQGVDVTASQADGTTALHWTAYWDDTEGADLLIRAGARVNAANELGVTPLWVACENASAPMVQRLLKAGANPNAALLSGETPLMTAARTGSAVVVKQLLDNGADVNVKERARGQTALMWAIAQRHADVVEVLLAHGADVRARSNVWTQVVKTTADQKSHPDYIVDIAQGGYTPLLFAARVGDLLSAKLLLDAGADVDAAAPYGTSPLVLAAHSGHGELAVWLLEKGADPNAAGAGYSALHAATLRHDAKLAGALLIHGADPNAPLRRSTPARRQSADFHLPPAFVGATPFWLAARYGQAEIMRLLMKHGADPRFVHHLDFWGQGAGYGVAHFIEGDTTTLMAAAGMGGRVSSGEGLVPVPDPDQVEAMTLEAVKVATESGVDLNAANVDGNTALHSLAARGYDAVVRFLVEKGAKLDVTNKKGQTPLAAAMAGPRPRESTVELLRKLGTKE